jgi:uncharacterized protein YxeA
LFYKKNGWVAAGISIVASHVLLKNFNFDEANQFVKRENRNATTKAEIIKPKNSLVPSR